MSKSFHIIFVTNMYISKIQNNLWRGIIMRTYRSVNCRTEIFSSKLIDPIKLSC
nr:MAG TPA: hypothetical protein [Caudoviricetes sp.]